MLFAPFLFCLFLFSFLGETPEASTVAEEELVKVSVDTLVSGLNVPWEMVWGPDKHIWITEQSGNVSRIDPLSGKKTVLVVIRDVFRSRSLGLLGLALHPDFLTQPYVFVDYTARKDSSSLVCRLVRYTYQKGKLTAPKMLLEFPAGTGHNGSRIIISPDRKIMFATGDAASDTYAQDINSLNGKVLRLNLDGSVPKDNPFKGSYVWSMGHRNIQGLSYGPTGILYASEHGDAVEDELNIIEKGFNYGWNKVEGYCDQPAEKSFCDSVKITEPKKSWTPTIAPAAITLYNHTAISAWKNSIILCTLKESDLRVLRLDKTGKEILSEAIYFDGVFGRLRSVCQSPDGTVYIATSNRDWNPGKGFPKVSDDKIIRIRRDQSGTALSAYLSVRPVADGNALGGSRGKELYGLYCVSCHKQDGLGVAGTFPPLKNAEQVSGAKDDFLSIILKGRKGEMWVQGKKYDQHMPSFSFLKDQDIAAVATYVRQNFGGKNETIETAEVAKLRNDSN